MQDNKDLFLYDPTLLDEFELSDWPKTSFPDSIKLITPGEGLRMRPLKRDDYDKGKLAN